ncbi:ribonuclease III [candidate division KSB1 bacterium]|nr:ribonuclease III [candidate division KSB1 bacterium]
MKYIFQKWLPTLFTKKYQSEKYDHTDWKSLEKVIGYSIVNKDIFHEALRHRSHPSCAPPLRESSNERMEFLGDALINFYVGAFLYDVYPDSPEGELTKMRSSLVSREFLAKKGKELKLGKFVVLGEGEERSGGRNKDSIISNAVESIIGALFLDGGHEVAKKFVNRVILHNYESVLESEGQNYKGELLEYIQKRHLPMPKFITKKETGPDHKKTYTVVVQLKEETFGLGKGKSKKIAEQEAARNALEKIMKNG